MPGARIVSTTSPSEPDSDRDRFDSAWDQFFAAVRRARGRALKEIEEDGLSLAQYQLLAAFEAVGGGEGRSVGALAEAAGVAQPTASRMLDGIEREGIIARRPSGDDRRRVEVELTAKGERILRRKRKVVAAKRAAVFASLDADDRARAASLLLVMAAAIEEEP